MLVSHVDKRSEVSAACSPLLRARLLAILTGQEPPRFPVCHGYQNGCACKRCLRRAECVSRHCGCYAEFPDMREGMPHARKAA